MPELDSQRKYMPFGEAAEKIIAAAVARAKPARTENIDQAESFRRIVQYAKQSAVKANADIGGNAFSYMSFVPHLAAQKIYGETVSYTFASGLLMVAVEREARGFTYRMKPAYSTPFYIGPRGAPARIYEPDKQFAFKNLPALKNGVVSYTNLCTSSTASCSVLSNYTPGTYRWFYRDSGQPWMVACNQVSDCVQAAVSMFFYNATYKYRRSGYDDFGQYWGNYKVSPSGTCNDTSEYAYLSFGMITGLTCIYSQQYEYTTSTLWHMFTVAGDFESSFLRYISLNPIPITCPGATKYPQFLACDPRFADDVLSLDSLVRLVDRMYWWGTQRDGYRGVKYTIVSKADALAVLGNTLVKVSSLADPLDPPASTAPAAPPSNPGSGTGGNGLDLGPNPGVPAPSLEDINGSTVLASLWNLFPSLSAWSPGSYAIKCPEFTPSVFGSTLHVDQHCALLEGQRVALGVLSLFAWASAALLVVLRA
ncbi:hypothetical protein CLU86_1152 [Acidovorax sp. 62]|uniref:hypothetical protein n=1 Tax=Acidovorax sp. 62 TaxID=2035203 RepID=UPI000C4C192E|nr:hypothetical protein [Acidovorax sp. 62]PIF90271.1 hypothetical protein CLU86_1152 [Acidovorax sp. 62]